MFDEHSDSVHWLPETVDLATFHTLRRTLRKMRKHGKVDENHRLIVSELRDVGAEVESTANIGNGFPDICCLFRGEIFLLEIKRDAKAKLTTEQEHFHIKWQSTNVSIVTSVEDALRAIGAISGKNWKPGKFR